VIAHPADDVEGLGRLPLLREQKRVLLHPLFHRRAHLRRGAEKPVRRQEPFQRLVRPLEVVAVDPERQPSRQIEEVAEDRAGEKLVPQGLPEALDLAQRLRMLRPRLEMPDSLPPELVLEFRLSPPDRVLAAVVGQHLLRDSVALDARLQRLHHQLALLVPLQRVSGDESRVVVHQGAEVDPLVPAQKEGEDIRLPELVRTRSLETPRQRLRPRHLRLASISPASCSIRRTSLSLIPIASNRLSTSRIRLAPYSGFAFFNASTASRRGSSFSFALAVLPGLPGKSAS
jgi:hypothetical protein